MSGLDGERSRPGKPGHRRAGLRGRSPARPWLRSRRGPCSSLQGSPAARCARSERRRRLPEQAGLVASAPVICGAAASSAKQRPMMSSFLITSKRGRRGERGNTCAKATPPKRSPASAFLGSSYPSCRGRVSGDRASVFGCGADSEDPRVAPPPGRSRGPQAGSASGCRALGPHGRDPCCGEWVAGPSYVSRSRLHPGRTVKGHAFMSASKPLKVHFGE